MGEVLLRLEGVSKSFGGIKAVRDVSLDVRRGEVHVLLGENGAGKSTLIKMIAGVHEPDTGRIVVDGKEVRIPDTRTSESLGIATIHQELNLVPELSVAENLTLGRTPRKFGLVDRRAVRKYAQEAIARIGLDVDVNRKVGTLGVARQQMIEIAKALAMDARILILDEPTAALTRTETDILFDVVRDLREQGVAMVFISHHLDEIEEIGDRITVLRDGTAVDTVSAGAGEAELVRLMVGRSIDDLYPRRRGEVGDVVLNVEGLNQSGVFEDISLEVRAGEVVGIAGLMGAGRTEVLRAIAGADSYESGSVTVHGKRLPKKDVAAAVGRGVGLVPEDRKNSGLVLEASVAENLGYATLRSTGRAGLADLRGQRRRSDEVAQQLRIRMASLDQQVRGLSGGNQQKVVFGRWSMAGSDVLLLDEPTRGVDVGAKVEIYELVNAITDAGGGVLLVSSDLPEVISMSDRVLVMAKGRIVGELTAEEATQDAVMSLAVKEVDSSRVR
ncbi:ribose transport system ATP-binding protein [Kineosphaera limosa]|uniref:Ribose ABC transporter ATP-binding protein n=1 Tax=Kineosphaera limosa NBRC 100340 TaxID=1184609 RepID=K6WU73_9MICO|nr:sugar ABC transporter ATP-binding protein [Kineosphaera limosa]NYE00638.1 ribose transport system ATP-binding protein [Kineosphaera limosa]GAB97371.1 ribose ABC transporter ATP-binding protein [Kineosphaera limosa NBRC 100340]